jgi:hypothetical protein
MRSSEPDQVFSSQKDAKEVTNCVVNKWEAWVNRFDDWGVVKSTETTDGYSVSALKYGPDPDNGTSIKPTTINYLADVENKGSGSETRLYQYLSLNLGNNPFFAAVAECQ